MLAGNGRPRRRADGDTHCAGVHAAIRRLGGSTSLLVAFTAVGIAAADEESSEPAGREQPRSEHASGDDHRLRWTFPEVRTWQYFAIAAQTAGNLAFETYGKTPGETWREPLPLDVPVRNTLAARSATGRLRADAVSDVLWHTAAYYPVVVDSLLVPLAFDGLNTHVAWQLTAVSWQTIGLTGLVTRAFHNTVPRARPSTYGCSPEPDAENPCAIAGPGFFSGHVSMTTAGAALSCMHHAALPLYGEGPAGAITCGVLSANAVAVGVLRMMADKHWFTDVVAGHLLGASIGLGLPWLLHYQHRITPDASALGISNLAWMPWATSDSIALSLAGQL
jgi:membrane-associated phospholipid phosphatase